MYSPYPGNLKNNGIVNLGNGVKYDYDKVGYIGYANISSRKAGFMPASPASAKLLTAITGPGN
jgi:hypothetical protein